MSSGITVSQGNYEWLVEEMTDWGRKQYLGKPGYWISIQVTVSRARSRKVVCRKCSRENEDFVGRHQHSPNKLF
jgi:hypothetical protein